MLATASEKGTVVRVFSIPDAKQLWQFRRGSSSAKIWSINFNLASTLLAVSSDSSTIHIYKLAGPSGKAALPEAEDDMRSPTPSETAPGSSPPEKAYSASSSLGRRTFKMGKSLVGGVGGYLPRSVSEKWEPQRDFAYIKLRGNSGKTVVALSA
jgi:autophagy-related protein 18